MADLKQTSTSFKVIGKVTGIDKEGAFREDELQSGKNEGRPYRALRFGVKTSLTNQITVEMFDMLPEEVFMWNSVYAKEARDNGEKYKGERFPYDEYHENLDELKEEGYTIISPRIGFERKADGKLDTYGVPAYDAILDIHENIDNGDSVLVEGEIRYSRYEAQDGKMKVRKTFSIKKLYKIDDIDFEADDFEEVSYFEQEIVFVDSENDKQAKKVYVTGRTILYNKDFIDSQFIVDYSGDDEDGTDPDMVKLRDAFLKKFKFGDIINIFGNAFNKVIITEREDNDSNKDDLLSSLGGRKKPSHADNTIKNYINEMQIEGVDSWTKRHYKEEDFSRSSLVKEEDEGKKELKGLGGKKKKTAKKDNPFDDGDLEISDSELPF